MKILTTGDNPYVSTGYGTVWFNFLNVISKERPNWIIKHIGWQTRDRESKRVVMDYVIKQEDVGKKIADLPGYFQLPMGKLEYGYDAVKSALSKEKPDFFISLADVGFQGGYCEIVEEAKKNGWKGKWIAYVPIDTEEWAMTWSEILSTPDIVVAMSKFGYERLSKHKEIEKLVLIPHGVDTSVFTPLKERNELKKKYQLDGKFVVGFVGRNQSRKMPDRLLLTFKNFAKGKNDVVLISHTDEEASEQGGISYPYLLWLFEIADKVKLTKKRMDMNTRQRIQPENLNEIYNMMDVFLYITGGEGFGLPGIECQSAGVPLLMAGNTTSFDLCREENKIPTLLDKYGRKCISRGGNGVYFEYPDDLEGSKLLEKFYKLWKEDKLEPYREDARKFSLNYDWKNIIPLWITLLENEI